MLFLLLKKQLWIKWDSASLFVIISVPLLEKLIEDHRYDISTIVHNSTIHSPQLQTHKTSILKPNALLLCCIYDYLSLSITVSQLFDRVSLLYPKHKSIIDREHNYTQVNRSSVSAVLSDHAPSGSPS